MLPTYLSPLVAGTHSCVRCLPLIVFGALWFRVYGGFPNCMPPTVRRLKDNIIEARLYGRILGYKKNKVIKIEFALLHDIVRSISINII